MSEGVIFTDGRPAVVCTLARAEISGRVGGELDSETDFWADVLDSNGDHISGVRLDRDSWNALKNKWMRCRMLPT